MALAASLVNKVIATGCRSSRQNTGTNDALIMVKTYHALTADVSELIFAYACWHTDNQAGVGDYWDSTIYGDYTVKLAVWDTQTQTVEYGSLGTQTVLLGTTTVFPSMALTQRLKAGTSIYVLAYLVPATGKQLPGASPDIYTLADGETLQGGLNAQLGEYVHYGTSGVTDLTATPLSLSSNVGLGFVVRPLLIMAPMPASTPVVAIDGDSTRSALMGGDPTGMGTSFEQQAINGRCGSINFAIPSKTLAANAGLTLTPGHTSQSAMWKRMEACTLGGVTDVFETDIVNDINGNSSTAAACEGFLGTVVANWASVVPRVWVPTGTPVPNSNSNMDTYNAWVRAGAGGLPIAGYYDPSLAISGSTIGAWPSFGSLDYVHPTRWMMDALKACVPVNDVLKPVAAEIAYLDTKALGLPTVQKAVDYLVTKEPTELLKLLTANLNTASSTDIGSITLPANVTKWSLANAWLTNRSATPASGCIIEVWTGPGGTGTKLGTFSGLNATLTAAASLVAVSSPVIGTTFTATTIYLRSNTTNGGACTADLLMQINNLT